MKNSPGQGECYLPRLKAEVDNILQDLQNSSYPMKAEIFSSLKLVNSKNRVVVVRSEHREIMVDTDYFFDVSFKTFRLVLEPSSVEI